MKIKNIEQKVLEALEKSKITRKNDFVLYGVVLQSLGVNLNRPLKDLFIYHKEMGCPSFESVTRCRRHIQELRPDLKISKFAILRENAEEEYINYNRSGLGE